MNTLRRSSTRGFTLIEALIALLIMSFGMLALAGMQLMLSRNADVAKQRTEAVRLAQERMERMRSYVGISAGAINWNALPVATETVTTNATYQVSVLVAGVVDDPMRPASVRARWLDRAGTNPVTADGFTYNQEVVINSVISRQDPLLSAKLSNPLPQNKGVKRPKNRNINIPIPAISLAGGKSATQFDNNYVIVYSDDSGGVVQICDPNTANATAEQIQAAIDNGDCGPVNGYILAGYVGRTTSGSTAVSDLVWAALTGIKHDITRNVAGTEGVRCLFSAATNQNTGAVITASGGYKYYLCVIPVEAPSLTSPASWGGTVRLAGIPIIGDYIACRYQYTQSDLTAAEKNIQPYASVSTSIDEQNYLITRSSTGTCPASMTVAGVSVGVLHQNCKSTVPAATLATNCPALPSF